MKRSNSSYEQPTNEIGVHVHDGFRFVQVHPEHDLEMGRVFIDGTGDDVSVEERGKSLLTKGQFTE
ncbi:MAG: hypothetical protein M3H12_00350 [Chromatiales bacterium]